MRHDGGDVGEVEIDETFSRNERTDRADGIDQNAIGHLERIDERHLLAGNGSQSFVGNRDERIDALFEPFDALFGLFSAAPAFEFERFSDDADGQSALLTRQTGDDRSRPSPRAPAHAGRHEDHVGLFEVFLDLRRRLLSRFLTDGRICTCAQSPCTLDTELDFNFGVVASECLCVGICRDELNAVNSIFDHRIDGVSAATANANDLDIRTSFRCIFHEFHSSTSI